MIRKKLIAGNWKMNKTSGEAAGLVSDIVAAVGRSNDVDVVVCPPFTSLESVGKALDGSSIKLGAQNMHPERNGAYTGEVSAEMLRSLFTSYVILGHSERRTYFGDTDAFVNQKVIAALKAELKPILCVGETLAELALEHHGQREVGARVERELGEHDGFHRTRRERCEPEGRREEQAVGRSTHVPIVARWACVGLVIHLASH